MTDTLKDFSIELKTQMTNCKNCLSTQPITADLAKNIQEIAWALLQKFRTFKAEGAFANDCSRNIQTLERTLENFHQSATYMRTDIEDMNLIFFKCSI